MIRFIARSIRQKIILLILGVSLSTLLVGFTLVVIWDIANYRQESIQSAILQARLVGQACISPLSFDDPAGVKQILSSLGALPDFRKAVLLDSQDKGFAEYSLSGMNIPLIFGKEKSFSQIEASFLHVWQPLIYKSQRLGTIYLIFSTDPLCKKINSRLLTILGLWLMLILTAFFLASRFQKLISVPILKLANAAEQISAGSDLSLRLEKHGEDEIGLLYDHFNNMLEQLQIKQNERKKVEKELIRTQSYLRSVLDSLSSAVISVDHQGLVEQWNIAFETLTGLNMSDGRGKILWDLVPYLSPYKLTLDETIRLQKTMCFHRETIPGEKKRIWDIAFFPVLQEGNEGAAVRIDDVTELVFKDEQLFQALKMETIGTLAGGLAHDFNNYLGGIIGTISLLQCRMEKNDMNLSSYRHEIKIIEESANRAAEMVHQLMALSRKQETSMQAVDLNTIINRVLRLSRHMIEKSVNIQYAETNHVVMVFANPAQIEQVIINLCINAAHAMTIMRPPHEAPGGTLSIAITRTCADAAFILRFPGATASEYWMIRFSDTGIGIPAKDLSRIFDPFFTSKRIGQGSGLGLSIVYNIIKQHQGFINVYSEPDKGTTFNVFLPVHGTDTPQGEKEEKQMTVLRGTGLILVVDDEDIVRQMACTILQECGYDVLAASNGPDAIRLFRAHKEKVQAILLDLAMPNMSGRECFFDLKLIRPDIKILLTSGFRQDPRVAELLANGVGGFLQKPYSLTDLAWSLKELLKKSPSE